MSREHFARALRLRRLQRHGPERMVVVPLDHAISDGPGITCGRSVSSLVRELAHSGVDAVVVHKGALRHLDPDDLVGMSLVVHLSASTVHAPDPDAKYLVTGVEEALRLGADAVSVHVNLGSLDERRQVQDLGSVAEQCDRWNLPLLAMVYPRGPMIPDPRRTDLVAHAASLAADLGADVVKTVYPGSAAAMAQVVAACPVPVLVAGGPQRGSDAEVLEMTRDALLGGASGVAMGRNIFLAARPALLAADVVRLVHQSTGGPSATGSIDEARSDVRREAVLA